MLTDVVAEIRRRSGLGLRELARCGGTSHATLHAYESGAKEPQLSTVVRLAGSAGFVVELSLTPRPDVGEEGRARKGEELEAALDLAAQFPARHRRRLAAPVFKRVA